MSTKLKQREFRPEPMRSASTVKHTNISRTEEQDAARQESTLTDTAQHPPGSPAHTLNLQRTIGNQAVVRHLGARQSRNTLQRTFVTLPVNFVGNDVTTAQAQLLKYLGTEAVATDGRTFKKEYARVLAALKQIQPTKAVELEARYNSIGMKKGDDKAIDNAGKLEVFINYINGLIATYALDTVPAEVTTHVDEDGSHHMDYFFKLPGDDVEKKFDLDEWSRKGKNFLNGASSGATIQGIVNEAVTDWDTTKGSIVTLLVARLLGTGPVSGSTETQNVSALFMNSPIGKNYTKILMAAEHIIGVRTNDLKPRGVKVQHWKKTTPEAIDNAKDGNINWPALLKTARAAFKIEMAKASLANQTTARNMAVTAIAEDTVLKQLQTLGVLKMDGTDGTFSLDNRPQRKEQDIYQAMPDERFNFDINHFTAILFFEWKAVTDLKQ